MVVLSILDIRLVEVLQPNAIIYQVLGVFVINEPRILQRFLQEDHREPELFQSVTAI